MASQTLVFIVGVFAGFVLGNTATRESLARAIQKNRKETNPKKKEGEAKRKNDKKKSLRL